MVRKLGIPVGLVWPDRLKWPLALAAGAVLWTLSLPPYGLGVLALVALVPALFLLPEEPIGRVAAWGWAGGVVWEFGTLWWLIPTLIRYGSISDPVAFLLVLGMCAVLGLYMAGFLTTLALLTRRRGETALALAPFAWVLWEWLRGHLFSGMPWWGPGYALSLYPALLQETRLFGILGLSFVAILCSASMAMWLRDRSHPATLRTSLAAVLLLAITFVWGNWQSKRPVEPKAETPVGYLQPNVPQDRKWDPAFSADVLKTTLDLAGAFKSYGLKLMVWPESSTPFEWDTDEAYRKAVAGVSAATKSPILLGSVLNGPRGYQNGAVLVLPDGKEGGRYAKTHLVPFGEYVPFRRFLEFARPIVDTIGDFVPGTNLQPLQTPAGRVGVTICFEGIFPELVRQQVRDGAQLLVNLTNDAWYEGTPGPVQHFLLERVRAVETDRYLVRSANRGISGVVNPRGKLEAATPPGQAASFWGLVEPRDTRTLWTLVGDWWLLAPLAVVALFLVPPSRSKERRPL